MRLADFIADKLNEFLVRAPILTSEQQILQENDETDMLLGEKRVFHNAVAVMCWMAARDGVLYVRRDSLVDGHPQQGKFRFEDQTLTFPHRHDFVELAYVARGTLRQQISGKDEVFCAGEFCLIDRDSLHVDYLNCDDSVVVFLCIENAFFSEANHVNAKRAIHMDAFYRKLILEKKQKYQYIRFVPKTGAEEQTHDVLKNILCELWDSRSGSPLIVQGYIERLLALLPTQYQLSMSNQELSQMRKALFYEVNDYLNEHYQQTRIKDLQAQFNYNADYFNRLIKQHTGMTYSKYLQSIRLDKALSLIKNTNYPIENIALQVGYSNLGYFYKIFYEKFKKKPGVYRQK